MFGWFLKNKGVERIEEDTKRGFDSVKKDIGSISGWIKHLESEKNIQKKEMEEIKTSLSTIMEELEGIKNVVSFIGEVKTNGRFKQPDKVFAKQTDVYSIQTGVQTGVQTPNLNHFSITERAIIWVLLNTDMKLSYEDIATMLGKDKTTIRGQINSIRQKEGNLIEESIEKNGRKRVFISEKIREKMLKKSKVRVKYPKK
jgi:biotin operon repressor